jgi:manganese/zinc/iron transport system permease protein
MDSGGLWILAVGALVGGSCALVGSFLVLRRMSLLGDAISHSVLPGIALAFLWTHSLAAWPMILGAGALGLLTVFLVESLQGTRRLHPDAAIGVVFPALFALGVILVNRCIQGVHFDLDCVLYGDIAFAPLDSLVFGGRSWGPRAFWVVGAVFLLDLLFVGLWYKELKVATFDPALASSLGISPVLIHYLLMFMVSLTVVACFESVGAILVVAMLIVPPAAAYLLTDRLGVLLPLAVGVGIASSSGGYGIARAWDCSIAGAMAMAAGGFFLLALLGAPRHGLLSQVRTRRLLRRRLEGNLLLLHLSRTGAVSPGALRGRFGWGGGRLDRALAILERAGLVERVPDGVRLSLAGASAIEAAGGAPLAHLPG